ncbi:MAG: protein-disulfide reductase DsbD N-terminal domain-containing protein [Ectothiorhodospiraceae bacterium]|nr:protein-disulfide reductase DsbD N-terminal domain-containing protein [Chromatiales bacterium]MCP5157474.1 protein-disulfide reductase DsbD N-terminal domain-containing protein [Ectothiorhodospiraceae bacterium]
MAGLSRSRLALGGGLMLAAVVAWAQSSAVPRVEVPSLVEQIAGRPGAAAEPDFLDVDVAFALDVLPTGPSTVAATWRIAPGYYLYRDRMRFTVAPATGWRLVTAALPAGDPKADPYFGETRVFHDAVQASLELDRGAADTAAGSITITYQGCAEAGLCYPPVTREFPVDLPAR